MMAFLYRRRKKLSLDGTVPGIVYNRHHGGHRPASAPIDNPAPSPSQDYMSSHPDEYDPHPGEAVFFEPDYSPYQADLPHRGAGGLHSPAHGFGSPCEHGGPPSDDELAFWPLSHQLPPDAIPIDHDVEFDGPIGPTINEPSKDHLTIAEIWDQVLDRPTYESLLMTDESFNQAMREVADPADAFDSVPIDSDEMVDDVMANQELPGALDEIPIDGDVLPEGFMGYPVPELMEELGSHAEMLLEPGVEAESGFDAPENLDGSAMDPLDYETGAMAPGSLEQIVDQLDPEGTFPDPGQPDPMMQEQMYEERMMDPYGMMPFSGPMGLPMGPMDPYGPMPPGLGPMGPGM